MLEARARGQRIAFVPTMGYLHEGHLSLLREGRKRGDILVLSIFVNPTQFGPNEDLARYPRDLAGDLAKAASAGTDLAFVPEPAAMYPDGYQTYVDVREVSKGQCGDRRPGHFVGVATVVLKLFNLVQPRVAVFGKKDFQQLRVIRDLVQQFNLPIEIVAGATLREADGLAMSSRNGYLTPVERAQAPQLHRELATLAAAVGAGERAYDTLVATARRRLNMAGWRVDYITVRDAATLTAPTVATTHAVVLGAAWLGKTRLIDNLECALPNLPLGDPG